MSAELMKKNGVAALYNAVQQYVKANGGSVVAIGGVEVQHWPGEPEYNFRLAIRCTGKRPVLKEAKP